MHERYIKAAKDAVEAWDGQDTADLFLDILQRTGESVLGVLEIAEYRFTRGLCKRDEPERPVRSDG